MNWTNRANNAQLRSFDFANFSFYIRAFILKISHWLCFSEQGSSLAVVIAAITVGSILGVVVLVLVFVCYLRQKRKNKFSSPPIVVPPGMFQHIGIVFNFKFIFMRGLRLSYGKKGQQKQRKPRIPQGLRVFKNCLTGYPLEMYQEVFHATLRNFPQRHFFHAPERSWQNIEEHFLLSFSVHRSRKGSIQSAKQHR